MGTRANVERRPGKRSVIGSILGSILLAGLVAMALELVATAFAPLGSPAQALARSVDGFIILERQIGRGDKAERHPERSVHELCEETNSNQTQEFKCHGEGLIWRCSVRQRRG